MGTRPFNDETTSTLRVSEKFAKKKKMAIKTKLKIKLVSNDLAVAAISDATASSWFATELKFSSKIVAPGD
jgi:hypothetical protein